MNATTKNILDQLEAVANQGGEHIVVSALAGTGKTTTLIEGLNSMFGASPKIIPSPQQEAIWEAMALSGSKASVAIVAFNKSIATELQDRVPANVDASTMHSMGLKTVTKSFGRVKVEKWRVSNIVGEILNVDTRELTRTPSGRTLINGTKALVSLCKQNLVSGEDKDELASLVAHYDVDLGDRQEDIFELVPKVLDRCKRVENDKQIDFDDMVWLPVILDLEMRRYDLLMVDEAQDLNMCQQAFAMKAGKRLVLVGDVNQAIYGFAGADSESLPRMTSILQGTERGCSVFPLTVTRRCGLEIVKSAQQIVPSFEAHSSNPKGEILELGGGLQEGNNCYRNLVKDGDMILCRVNAPLVQQCFRFLREGRKAYIQGRDIGKGLITLIKKQKSTDVNDLIDKLELWYQTEVRKENVKRNPSDSVLISLQDKYNCLTVFTEGAQTVDEVIENIEVVFADNQRSGIRLSSVHRSKGLEADHVFILRPSNAPMPHPLAQSEWQQQQEMNIKYVAITRAIQTLTWVFD